MKADLNLALIKRLKISERPVGLDAKGTLVFEANVGNKPYILWDSNRDAPPGFGVRVAGKKTYIVRRKVNGVSIMPTVGNVSDFLDLGLARKKAAELARAMVETGKNPNQSRREASALEPTLGDVLASYRNHLATRVKRRASPETLRAVDRAANKFKEWNWAPRKLKELTTDEIIEQFQRGTATPTATEQTFRFASTATKWAIGKEMLDATHEGRAPALTVNLFTILTLHGMYRSRAQIAREREERGARNPLSPSETLGPFLEAAWSKRLENDNRTAERMHPFLTAFEFRHESWFNEKHRESTLAMERERGIVHVIVDAPEGVTGRAHTVWEVTSPELAIVRLHGRNAETWSSAESAAERFNYEYSDEELRELAVPIQAIAKRAGRTHVLFNNCWRDVAQRNARTFLSLTDPAVHAD